MRVTEILRAGVGVAGRAGGVGMMIVVGGLLIEFVVRERAW